MSRRFAFGHNIVSGYTPGVTNNFWLGFWLYLPVSGFDSFRIYAGNAGADGYGIDINSSYSLQGLYGGVTFWGGGTVSGGSWMRIDMVRSGGTSQVYKNGAAFGSSTGSAPNAPSSALATSSYTWSEDAAYLYLADLTWAEFAPSTGLISGLGTGANVFKMASSFHLYWPLLGFDSPESDWSGNGRTGMVTNAAADTFGPPTELWLRQGEMMEEPAAAPGGGNRRRRLLLAG